MGQMISVLETGRGLGPHQTICDTTVKDGHLAGDVTCKTPRSDTALTCSPCSISDSARRTSRNSLISAKICLCTSSRVIKTANHNLTWFDLLVARLRSTGFNDVSTHVYPVTRGSTSCKQLGDSLLLTTFRINILDNEKLRPTYPNQLKPTDFQDSRGWLTVTPRPPSPYG